MLGTTSFPTTSTDKSVCVTYKLKEEKIKKDIHGILSVGCQFRHMNCDTKCACTFNQFFRSNCVSFTSIIMISPEPHPGMGNTPLPQIHALIM